jgi:hypothetical protein
LYGEDLSEYCRDDHDDVPVEEPYYVVTDPSDPLDVQVKSHRVQVEEQKRKREADATETTGTTATKKRSASTVKPAVTSMSPLGKFVVWWEKEYDGHPDDEEHFLWDRAR